MGVIDILHSFSKYLPEVKNPIKAPTTQEKLIWTGIALVLYFMMYETTAFGVKLGTGGVDFLQTITASRFGSLLTAGIGPIVFASIFLQLFAGAGIIKIDLKDKKDKQKFLETQKVLAILLAIIEGIMFVLPGSVPITPLFAQLGETVNPLHAPFTMALVVLQIALGSVIIMFLDELVTKYGLGSGISLFIAAGVSLSVATGLVGIIFGANGVVTLMSEGGAEALPNALLALLPFVFSIIVFLVVVYAELLKVEIPIAFERVRGMVPRLPLKFFYVSNIPVIFATALIANMQFFAANALVGAYWDKATKVALNDPTGGYSFDKNGILPIIGYVDQSGTLRDGLFYLFTPVYGFGRGALEHWTYLMTFSTPVFGIPEWMHAIIYILGLGIVSVIFGLFWVEISNMDAKSVANQLSDSGIQIPGFRRDPRMLESILNKHIYPLTVMGSFSVGLLAGLADLTGALGTGTGILLTVGILYRMYEQLEQTKAFDAYPSLGAFLGE